MTAKPKFRTMYMHTLDGKPVTFREWGGWFMSTYGWTGTRVQLRPSLRAIRQDIARARKDLAARQLKCYPLSRRRAALDREFARYGYVRVEVPK